MLKNRERTVQFYDLHANTAFRGHDAKPVPKPTADCLSLAKAGFDLFRAQGNLYIRRDGGKSITLDDWQVTYDRTQHHLVFSCADPEIGDPAFKDMNTGVARMAGKTQMEAVDKSAHVLIKLPSADSPTQPALMLMTGGAGIAVAKVATMLGGLLKHAARLPEHRQSMRRSHPSGVAGQTLPIRISFQAAAHQSRLLQDILRSGGLEAIELISDRHDTWDSDPGFIVTSAVIKVQAVNVEGPMSLQRLSRLVTGDRGIRYDKARIFFRESPSAEKESHLFDTSDLEQAFSKRERITFDTDIPSKHTRVSNVVIDKMRELLYP